MKNKENVKRMQVGNKQYIDDIPVLYHMYSAYRQCVMNTTRSIHLPFIRFTAVLVSMLVLVSTSLNGQNCKKMYKSKLAPDSKFILCEYNYSVERLADGNYVYKRYFPETKQITEFITFKGKSLKIKDGLYYKAWDDGTIVTKGSYSNGVKTGQWTENVYDLGTYQSGIKTGTWKTYTKDNRLEVESNYVNGKLNGKQVYYDSLSNVIKENMFKLGELVNTAEDTTSYRIAEEMPRFQGCEDLELDPKELNSCAQRKLLQYIYSHLRYPREARRLNVEGTALIKFVVDKDGSLIDIKVLSGVCQAIQERSLELIQQMPKWRPGYQDGKPVKVQYTLPIVYRLK